MIPWRFAVGMLWFSALAGRGQDAPSSKPLWDVATLLDRPPAVELGAVDGMVQEVWYAGEDFAGKPTRVFAYLGKPNSAPEAHPAMLLVHGGGGRAFKDWAKHWAARGYVALAMDTAGQGPDGKRHANAGPNQSDASKFRPFSDAGIRDMWTFHAVAAIVRGHALLAVRPDVDAGRIGITGISWGGYLTCLTAGIDAQLKVAVPVYGCGFLGDNSHWRDRSLAALGESQRARWLTLFDPSSSIGNTACPILFLNGTHDFAYPPDSYRKTYLLVKPELRTLALRVDLPHGHIWTFGEVDAFVDFVLKPGATHAPLVRLGATTHDDQNARAEILPGTRPIAAELQFTTDTGSWQQRKWQTRPAVVGDTAVSAPLPVERPLTFFLTASDNRGLITSSLYAERGTSENSACLPKGKLENDFYEWNDRHAAIMKIKETLNPEVILIGDSITHLWGGEPAEPQGNRGAESWAALFGKRRVLNLGFGYDRTQNVLMRIDRGELDGLRPKAIVIHIGTNNTRATPNARENTAAEIAEGIAAVVERTKAKCPAARLILMAIFPRGEQPGDPARAKVAAVNALLPAVAKATGATLVDIGPQLIEKDGTVSRETMPDFLHPAAKGYAIWAEALKPLLAE
jgi:lysophospholipase L1-like esterase/dienelactone hydrolase